MSTVTLYVVIALRVQNLHKFSLARWGRCQEGYGEDPYLQGELATQYITALQNMNSSKYVEAAVSYND